MPDKNPRLAVGGVFGNLTILDNAPSINGRRYFYVECTCENVIEVMGASLASGRKTHCGCLRAAPYTSRDAQAEVAELRQTVQDLAQRLANLESQPEPQPQPQPQPILPLPPPAESPTTRPAKSAAELEEDERLFQDRLRAIEGLPTLEQEEAARREEERFKALPLYPAGPCDNLIKGEELAKKPFKDRTPQDQQDMLRYYLAAMKHLVNNPVQVEYQQTPEGADHHDRVKALALAHRKFHLDPDA